MKVYCIVDDVENLKNPDTYRLLKEAADLGVAQDLVVEMKAEQDKVFGVQVAI